MNDMQILDELEELVKGRIKTSNYNLIDWIGTPSEPEYRGYVEKWLSVSGWLKRKRMETIKNLGLPAKEINHMSSKQAGRANERSKG